MHKYKFKHIIGTPIFKLQYELKSTYEKRKSSL